MRTVDPLPCPAVCLYGNSGIFCSYRIPPELRLSSRLLARYPRAHDYFVEHWIDSLLLAVSMKTRLRVLRAEKEWSQAELAAHVGVARGTINAIETGKYDPSLPLAFQIARIFGKNVEEVFLYPEEQDQARPPRV